jgi:hypothetical protein
VLSKANTRATVHRPGYLDYVGVKRFDAKGQVVGERRILGLYTHNVYTANLAEISSGTLFSSVLIAGGSLAGILYAALYGRNLLPEADSAETLGLIPFLHEGTVGMVAGGLLFAALAMIVVRVAARKVQ